MRVAALYDVHGNLPALEAVLHEVGQVGVDLIVVGGDVTLGPMPREVLGRLHSLETPVTFIEGNCDRDLLSQLAGTAPTTVPQQVRELIRWTADQLRSEPEQLLRWPKTFRTEIGGLGTVLFCHATPRSDSEIFTRLTPEDRLTPIFQDIGPGLVVCGHTHMQFDRMVGTTRVVNAGSVGMPFGDPGAYWLLLGPNVELRRTLYDFAGAAERIRGTSYPQADDFAARNVLKPPAEEEMLSAFGKAELKA
jgi:putative phosphoesterase